MIIKGIFRRYERWNPVHPTLGTFWGMGIGVGCGVGWGPGFGPEVIGYVGAGCGAGFSVGITLLGVGIGLPQNGLCQIPFNAFATSTFLECARTYAVAVLQSLVRNRKESRDRFLSFKQNVQAPERVDLSKLHNAVSGSIRSTAECLGAFKNQHWPPGKVT
ncbi:Cadmium-induced protein AS8 [Ananas comosus]|uniref:Cadmium-induced protein AS8 n=1 Tax=Ananas comosus TaxID=4615 RepID=A0A199W3D4_ANACO|nr:Cadmium-induced protein AS8 [Ananas comosus]